jgi:NADH dehydrogenase (ubiquinone) 1 alpha/beta subcomplex 1, acyl-carrier protein
MFRTALLRTAPRAASMVAVRPAAARNFIAVAARPVRVMAPRAASYQAVRMYSAGGGLNKEEVEGRIMKLLSGFDKVSPYFSYTALGKGLLLRDDSERYSRGD